MQSSTHAFQTIVCCRNFEDGKSHLPKLRINTATTIQNNKNCTNILWPFRFPARALDSMSWRLRRPSASSYSLRLNIFPEIGKHSIKLEGKQKSWDTVRNRHDQAGTTIKKKIKKHAQSPRLLKTRIKMLPPIHFNSNHRRLCTRAIFGGRGSNQQHQKQLYGEESRKIPVCHGWNTCVSGAGSHSFECPFLTPVQAYQWSLGCWHFRSKRKSALNFNSTLIALIEQVKLQLILSGWCGSRSTRQNA